jgi:hypothetical protein
MYYGVQGTGRPLILIHGGVCTIDTCFGKLRPLLALDGKTISVVAVLLLVMGPGRLSLDAKMFGERH